MTNELNRHPGCRCSREPYISGFIHERNHVMKVNQHIITISIIAGLVSMLSLSIAPLYACTAIRLIAGDGGVVVGRTMEFGVDPQSDAVVVPAGTELTSSLADKSAGIRYKTKYGVVGADFMGKPMIVDGLNEKGMYVGALYFPGYADYRENSSEIAARALAPEDYTGWLLASFSSVAEVKANYDKVVIVENPIKELGGQSFPGHYIVVDQTGASVVIEPVDKTLKIYDNPLGVMTNSPTFDWHMTNISNYVNLSPVNAATVDLGEIKIAGFGQGSGMLGIPGDFTPPSRFIRAAAFSLTAVKLPTAKETVLQMFHIMNAFDIPIGAISESKDKMDVHDYTIWTSVSDLKNIRWAFKTYRGQTIQSIDVREALAGAGSDIRVIEMESAQPVIDVSTKFEKKDGDELAGADRDEHGCIGSAGYQWCERTGECERAWELAKEYGFENTQEAFDQFCQNPTEK